MNIFALDRDYKNCAEMHCDKHVVKMILEYAQLLCTAHRMLDGFKEIDYSSGRKATRFIFGDDRDSTFYKSTHPKHPSSIWAKESKQNYIWLFNLWVSLSNEYTHRYGKIHKSYSKLKDVLETPPTNINNKGLTEVSQAMPDIYKGDDFVQAYRNYYIGDKKGFAKWTNRKVPKWYKTT